MKKFLVAFAAAGMICFASTADAQAPAEAPIAAAPIVESTPMMRTTSTRTVRTARRGGLLSDLIELERRKNAWLRRTFFGR